MGKVYASKPGDSLGWYKPHLHTSLQWIRDLALPRTASIIDIGGGASTLVDALQPGGHVIMSTFAPEAPPRCSGLPVERYDAARLWRILGEGLVLERSHNELHTTPGGVEQMYLYCQFRRQA